MKKAPCGADFYLFECEALRVYFAALFLAAPAVPPTGCAYAVLRLCFATLAASP